MQPFNGITLKAIFLTHYTLLNCFMIYYAWHWILSLLQIVKNLKIDIVCRICLMWMNLEIISSISSTITSGQTGHEKLVTLSKSARPVTGAGWCWVSLTCYTWRSPGPGHHTRPGHSHTDRDLWPRAPDMFPSYPGPGCHYRGPTMADMWRGTLTR